MSDNDTQNEAQPSTAPVTPSDGTSTVSTTVATVPYERFKEVNTQNAELKKRLAAIEAEERKRADEAKQAEEQRLSEQNEFKALYEKRTAELTALTPKAQQADELLALITEQNDARISELPEDLRTLIPGDYDPVKLSRWLTANLPKLKSPTAPSLDGGRAGDRGKVPPRVELPPRKW